MKKLAIFVEGQTEQIFLKSFIEEIAGARHIEFDCKVLKAGAFISLQQKSTPGMADDVNYFVLLVDCQCDEKVKSLNFRTWLCNRNRLISQVINRIPGQKVAIDL